MPVGIVGPDAAVHHVGVLLVRGAAHSLVHVGLHPIVAVHKAQVFALGQGQPTVAGPPLTAVIQGQGLDLARPGRGVIRHDLPGAVGRAVVDQDDLHVRQCLRQQGFHAGIQISLRLVDGDDHAQLHACSSPTRSRVAQAISARISAR